MTRPTDIDPEERAVGAAFRAALPPPPATTDPDALDAAFLGALGAGPCAPPSPPDIAPRLAGIARRSLARARRRAFLRRAAAAAALLLLLAGCATATGYFAGLLRRAKAGDADAQMRVGNHYLFGKDVDQDPDEAAKWLFLSAEQKNPIAQNNLGLLFLTGSSVPQNDDDAFELFRKSAEQGEAAGQYNLACCYLAGRGVETNVVEAVRWFRKAAEQEYAPAMGGLGQRYFFGQGVEPDPAVAAEWYRKTIDRIGETPNDDVEKDVLVQSLNRLGSMYRDGLGVKRNIEKATELFRRADGVGDPTYSVPEEWRRAYDSDRPNASRRERERHWAERGSPLAQYSYGWMLWEGFEGKRDIASAVEWFRKAAERGSGQAQYTLGWAYYLGSGIAQDKTQAVFWWRKAAENGIDEAELALESCQGREPEGENNRQAPAKDDESASRIDAAASHPAE